MSDDIKNNEQEPIIFQIIDWGQYHEIDNSNDQEHFSNKKKPENSDEDIEELEKELDQKQNLNNFTKYKIRLYGRTQENKSVILNVNNYSPFFYIKLPRDSKNPDGFWTDTKIRTLISLIKQKISNPVIIKGFKSFEIIKRKDLYGFTAYKDFQFVRLIFHNMTSYKKFEYWIQSNTIDNKMIYNIPFKLKLYESNIEPFIRCMHIRKLNACGWVKISKYTKNLSTYSYCDIQIQTDWNNLERYESSNIQKFVIASWDIECVSSSGEFPQAIDPNDNENLSDNTKPGDPVIQIGTVFTYYGESEPFYKKIITLKGCEKINGLEDVDIESYNNEKDVLIAWSKLIQQKDPDILTGWNINGFDFSYVYNRARKLKILDKFSELSRIQGEKSEFKEKVLASSALGDNLLKYFDMNGRIVIDMMKERQRESKLDSYKLDFVASTYIKEKIVMCEINSSTSSIYTTGVYGIKALDYINVTWDDGLSENKNDHKYQILSLEKVSQDEIEDLINRVNSYPSISNYEFKKHKNLFKLIINGIFPKNIFEDLNEQLWHHTEKINNSNPNSILYFQVESHAHPKEEPKCDSVIKTENDEEISWIDQISTENKIPIKGNKVFWSHAKDDITPKQLGQYYRGTNEERGIIAKYCIMDCILVSKLMEKLQVLNNNIGMANVCGVPLSYIFMKLATRC